MDHSRNSQMCWLVDNYCSSLQVSVLKSVDKRAIRECGVHRALARSSGSSHRKEGWVRFTNVGRAASSNDNYSGYGELRAPASTLEGHRSAHCVLKRRCTPAPGPSGGLPSGFLLPSSHLPPRLRVVLSSRLFPFFFWVFVSSFFLFLLSLIQSPLSSV